MEKVYLYHHEKEGDRLVLLYDEEDSDEVVSPPEIGSDASQQRSSIRAMKKNRRMATSQK